MTRSIPIPSAATAIAAHHFEDVRHRAPTENICQSASRGQATPRTASQPPTYCTTAGCPQKSRAMPGPSIMQPAPGPGARTIGRLSGGQGRQTARQKSHNHPQAVVAREIFRDPATCDQAAKPQKTPNQALAVRRRSAARPRPRPTRAMEAGSGTAPRKKELPSACMTCWPLLR